MRNSASISKDQKNMQQSSLRVRGLFFALGVMTLCLGAGLACPGNLDPAFQNQQQGQAGSTGNAGSGPAGAGGGATFPSCAIEPTMLLKNKCGMASCHTPNNTNAGGLDLSSDGVASRLVGVTSAGDNGAQCNSMVYLNPGSNPATGLLIDKLTAPTCGDMMPSLGAWTDTNTQCVQEWAKSVTAP
jgi:hypothetical protein